MFKTFVVMLLCVAMLVQSIPEANAQSPLEAIPKAFGDAARSVFGSGSRLVRRSADVQPEVPTNPISPPAEIPSKE